MTVRRNTDGSFGPGSWVDLNYPGDARRPSPAPIRWPATRSSGSSSAPRAAFSYQATVNTGFQLSNVISGNGGNGIGIYGANDNQIAMNDIGTDATGTLRRGNAQNGILVTDGASGNLIGGQATGGNDPDRRSVFVRPPQGNLISGNDGDGVLINKRCDAEHAERQLRRHDGLGRLGPGQPPRRRGDRRRQRQLADRLHASSKTRSSSTT